MGKLIVIEGTECSGKETQSKMLAKVLKEKGYPVVHFAFPMYDTPTGKIVGGSYLGKKEISPSFFEEDPSEVDPYIACLYYAADRKYNFNKIEKYLKEDYFVILDRYISSNMAHQGAKILDKEERFHMYQWIDKLEYWLLQLPKPDQTFFLHLPYEYSKELKQKENKIENKEYLKNSEEAYIELSELYNWNRIECIREEKIKTIEQINQEILNQLELNVSK